MKRLIALIVLLVLAATAASAIDRRAIYYRICFSLGCTIGTSAPQAVVVGSDADDCSIPAALPCDVGGS